MLFWIFTGVIALIVLVVCIVQWRAWGWRDGLAALAGGVFIGGMAWGVICVGVLGGIGSIAGTWVQTTADQRSLTALNTGSEINGRFFLGSGYIDEQQVFSYIYQDAEGGFHLDSVPAANTTVFEGDDEPHQVILHWVKECNQFATPMCMGQPKTETYEFHVPTGSVLSDYKVSP